jgi:hypothetical protein
VYQAYCPAAYSPSSTAQLLIIIIIIIILFLSSAHYSSLVSYRSPSLFCLLVHSRCRGCLFSLYHTQTHTTVGRTPLDEGSARRRDLYLTTEHSQQTNIHARGEIRTHDPSKRSAAGQRLRPRGHWSRHYSSKESNITRNLRTVPLASLVACNNNSYSL